MQIPIAYQKPLVIQALRYHFLNRNEIRILLVLVNVFAIISAILFALKKVSPLAFLLSSLLWVLLMGSIWFLLPNIIYGQNETFKNQFIIHFDISNVHLETERGNTQWAYQRFSHWLETPNFFHLYFDSKSFFLVPKEAINSDQRHDLRELLTSKIGAKS
jgi:hypothetical protein